MKKETMIQLAKRHDECMTIHQDIKELIPEEDAQALLDAGFVDASYGNDEVPSYYHPEIWDLTNGEAVLYAIDDVDEDHNRISGKITYYIGGENVEYSNITDAIRAYKELNK